MSIKKKSVAFIVGAGAVANAWNPVLRALQPYFDFELTGDGANSFLARVIYLLRWWSSNPTPIAAQELSQHKEFLVELRQAICRELLAAELNGEIHVRPEFEAVVNATLLSYSSRFSLITTNWDRVVNIALAKYLDRFGSVHLNPIHIHGSIANAETLYLPTEMTKEPYRTHEEEQTLGMLHSQTWQIMEEAQRVVIYGLSISPLDAELGQILACGVSNPNLREVIVIAPDHELIAHRVNLLLDPRREVKVVGHEPWRLETINDHTVRRRTGA